MERRQFLRNGLVLGTVGLLAKIGLIITLLFLLALLSFMLDEYLGQGFEALYYTIVCGAIVIFYVFFLWINSRLINNLGGQRIQQACQELPTTENYSKTCFMERWQFLCNGLALGALGFFLVVTYWKIIDRELVLPDSEYFVFVQLLLILGVILFLAGCIFVGIVLLAPKSRDIDFHEMALFVAAGIGDVEWVKFLVSNGVNINVKFRFNSFSDTKTPLDLAMDSGHTQVVNYLKYGYRDLFEAVFEGTVSDIRCFLERGATVNEEQHGSTPLHIAVEYSKEGMEVAKLLVDRGADVNLKDSDGKTPLDLAVEDENTEMIKYLEAIGAKSGKDLITKPEE